MPAAVAEAGASQAPGLETDQGLHHTSNPFGAAANLDLVAHKFDQEETHNGAGNTKQ